MKKFRTEIFEKNFPCEELTELLHVSYKEHMEAGNLYLAATQTAEDTKRRLEGCVCAVAYNEDNKIIATMACKLIKKEAGEKRKWYEDDSAAYFEQMAVHPDYRKTKVALQLRCMLEELEWVKNADSIMIDTSELATNLVKGYTAMGFQIVDTVSWGTTNYYSFIFRKPVKGKRYDDKYVKMRFFFSDLACRLRYTKYGKRRFLSK